MVKGVARSGGSSSTSTPQQLPTMQAGQNPLDPLTTLNSHAGYGAMAGLNPFADMGVNPNDPNMVRGHFKMQCSPASDESTSVQMGNLMNSPQFLQQMSAMMSNPQIMDQVINSNPQLAAMGPQVREAFNSPQFREMMYVMFLMTHHHLL